MELLTDTVNVQVFQAQAQDGQINKNFQGPCI